MVDDLNHERCKICGLEIEPLTLTEEAHMCPPGFSDDTKLCAPMNPHEVSRWWATELYPSKDEENFGKVGDFEVVDAAAYDAVIERVKELECPRLKQYQSCGCVICFCDGGQCQGCGAMLCHQGHGWPHDKAEYELGHPLQAQLTAAKAERDALALRMDETVALCAQLLRENLRLREALEHIEYHLSPPQDNDDNANVYIPTKAEIIACRRRIEHALAAQEVIDEDHCSRCGEEIESRSLTLEKHVCPLGFAEPKEVPSE